MIKTAKPPHSTHATDISIRPQDDFFSYVNKEWLDANPIPESETRWGTFNVLREQSWKAMRDIFVGLQEQQPAVGTIEQQAKDFYHTGMHFNDYQDAHFAFVRNFFQELDDIKDTSGLSRMIGRLHAMDVSGPWVSYVDSDHDDNLKHIFHFRQSGLTLPNRDYYLEDSDRMVQVRAAYKQHVQKVYAFFPELGSDAQTYWEALMDFETTLATVSRPSADLRDVTNNYHKTPYDVVRRTYPAIDFPAYATALGWQPDDKITIDQPEFMDCINDLYTKRPLEDWKAYLKWRFLSRCLSKINDELSQVHFEFFGKVLSGTTAQMPLWKRVVLWAEHAIGAGTGRLYAEQYFPESSKKQVLSLVEDVRGAYSERIEQLDWMGADSKKYAQKKLANMKVLIGYPDKWRDYSALIIGRTSYLDNIFEAQKFDVAYWLRKLHQPTSRDDWFMSPQTVNAYHDPNRLVICFPAAILQRPFFDMPATYAVNMGGIGAVIGHELTHGFDDQGCMYDANGNVRTWQTDNERAAFAKKAQVIIDQADAFEVLPGLMLRGKLVLGESIADLGGLEIALHALKQKGEVTTAMLQEFFVNYAVTHRARMRSEKVRENTLADPHPSEEFRVNAILQHVDDFYTAFAIMSGDTLYLESDQQAKIW